MGATKVSPPSDRDPKVTTPCVRATEDSPPLDRANSWTLNRRSPSCSYSRRCSQRCSHTQGIVTAGAEHTNYHPTTSVPAGARSRCPPCAAENATTAALYATDRWRSLPGPGRCTRRKLPRAVHQDTEQLSSDHSQTA
jgi:hypothetical protein